MDKIDVSDKPTERRDRLPRDVSPDSKLHWRIYYRDGRRVGSHESSWDSAPKDDVVAVVQALDDEVPSVELGTPYYWHLGDWIARVWDPTLYLRQTGLVKFGRWSSHAKFASAWKHALASISHTRRMDQDESALQCGAISVTSPAKFGETGTGWAMWYDDCRVFTNEHSDWMAIPDDGVLCAVYAITYSGIKVSFAIRRYTYYFWRGHELVNTDDLDEVLNHFPACKRGQPAFTGKSYRHQGEAIAAALADKLDDVRAHAVRQE